VLAEKAHTFPYVQEIRRNRRSHSTWRASALPSLR
jgi:hypothetical protein